MTLVALSDRERAPEHDSLLQRARAELRFHAQQLDAAAHRLDERFIDALEVLTRCRGRVVVCGTGKSGIVARKIAATLACTGTPALFLHPSEAAHGDLGVVTETDVVIAVSYSGETPDLLWLLPYFRKRRVPVIALAGDAQSTLARAAAVTIDTSLDSDEPTRVPTTSALVAQAIGDALAIATMRARNVSEECLAELHPGSPGPIPPPRESGTGEPNR